MINCLYDRFHLFIGHGRVARQTQFGLRNVFGEGQMQAVPFRIASLEWGSGSSFLCLSKRDIPAVHRVFRKE